jgi:basic membrane lipoprotein Med (substrate-binding protein (PBP1-ABC) superfamily)
MVNAPRRALKFGIALAIVGVAAAMLVATASSSSRHATGHAAHHAAAPLKIAFMDNGPITDGGWTEAISDGRVAVMKNLGNQVSVTYTANIPFGPDITRVAQQYIKQGYKVLVDGACGGCAEFLSVCKQNPQVKCLLLNGNPPFPNNTAGYFPRYWESAYLVGMTAGLLTKSNKIGTVMAFNLPLIDSIVNSYTLGCQSVNPKCQVLTGVQNSWLLPAKTQQIASSLADSGADFLWSFLDDSTTARVAEQRGAWAAGAYLDQLQYAPKHYATGQVFQWGGPLTDAVKQIIAGTWKPGLYLSNLGSGVQVGQVWGPSVPADVKAKVLAMKAKIEGGYNPFVGPIYDKSGKLRVKAGQSLDTLFLYYKWNWQVKGIK